MQNASLLLALISVIAYLTAPCTCATKTIHRKLKKSFTGVTVDGPFVVTVTFGEEEEITLTGEDQVLQAIQTRVTPEGTLGIRFRSSADIRSPGNVQIRVTAIAVSGLVASSNSQIVIINDITVKNNLAVACYGSSQVILQGVVTTGTFSAVVSTSSNLVAAVAVENVNVVTSGTSSVTLTGTAENAQVSISDSSQFHGAQLVVQFFSASVTGKAKGEFNALKETKVSVNQSGTAITMGPAKVTKEVRDHGSVLAIAMV